MPELEVWDSMCTIISEFTTSSYKAFFAGKSLGMEATNQLDQFCDLICFPLIPKYHISQVQRLPTHC